MLSIANVENNFSDVQQQTARPKTATFSTQNRLRELEAVASLIGIFSC